ncbi:MAG: hypothetical protein JW764_06105 [Chlorobiaceae bacterium]|nr:hypothetical protein [Chlorobiaceae bacterium]
MDNTLAEDYEMIALTHSSAPSGPRTVHRRPKFASTNIYLPLVLRVEDDETRPLRYEEDILSAIDWQHLDILPLAAKIPDNASAAEQQMQRIRLVDSGGERIVSEAVGASQERLVFDTAYAVRMISDIVPNAWWASDIVGDLLAALKNLGFDDAALGRISGLIVEELRKGLEEVRTDRAEALFRHEVAEGRIQFRLRADGRNWQLPETAQTFEPEGADQLNGANGGPLEKSLFSPIYKGDFSSKDERDVAIYLDEQKALTWWHRNVARSHYAVQGWRREKVYPDFIFAMQQAESKSKLVVLEMKGNHLAGNDDTEYKKAVLKLMTTAFAEEPRQRIGELELVHQSGPTVECDLVLFPEWKTRLPELMK